MLKFWTYSKIYKLDITYNLMAIQTRLRRWGNSFGIVVPSEIMQEKNFQEGEEVVVDIQKKNKIKEIFGSLKDWNVNSQKEKDRLRKEWKE